MNENNPLFSEQLPSTNVVYSSPGQQRGVKLETIEDMWRFAKAVSMSGLAPRGMEKPESILVCIQAGAELGFTPMMSLQCIAVINGRPGIFGDAALALVRQSGLCEFYEQDVEGKGDDRVAIVTSKRRGQKPLTTRFAVWDAKVAHLWGKTGPWTDYPERMLLFRARGFNLRDNFGDILKGFKTTEELADYRDEQPQRDRNSQVQDSDSRPQQKRTYQGRDVRPTAPDSQPDIESPGLDMPKRRGRPPGSARKDQVNEEETPVATALETGENLAQASEVKDETVGSEPKVDPLVHNAAQDIRYRLEKINKSESALISLLVRYKWKIGDELMGMIPKLEVMPIESLNMIIKHWLSIAKALENA